MSELSSLHRLPNNFEAALDAPEIGDAQIITLPTVIHATPIESPPSPAAYASEDYTELDETSKQLAQEKPDPDTLRQEQKSRLRLINGGTVDAPEQKPGAASRRYELPKRIAHAALNRQDIRQS